MDHPHRTTPPVAVAVAVAAAAARPKNSSSAINSSSSHAAASSQHSSAMAPGSRTTRGSTPAASRSASKLADDKTATRPPSRDSLTQKMLNKPDDAMRPNKSEEVRSPPQSPNACPQSSLTRSSSSRHCAPSLTPCAHISRARYVTACCTSRTR